MHKYINRIPIRKSHSFTISMWKDEVFCFNFLQATAWETLIFEQNKETVGEFVQKMINTHGKLLYPTWYSKIDPFWRKKVLNFLWINLESYFSEILDKLHTPYVSMYEWINKKREKWEKNRKWFFWSVILWVCNEWNVSLDALLSQYTMEQVMWMYDVVVFKSYESTKTWMVANDQMFAKNWDNSDMKWIMERMKNLQKNPNYLKIQNGSTNWTSWD